MASWVHATESGGVTRDGNTTQPCGPSAHENAVSVCQDPHGATPHIMLRRTVDNRHAGGRIQIAPFGSSAEDQPISRTSVQSGGSVRVAPDEG
jgi:hypothetical protein